MTDIVQDNLLQKISRQIRDHQMFAPQDCWLLAISGGCDSMAMLHGLCMLRQTQMPELSNLQVAHLNHQLRGAESDADAEFVQQQAKSLGLEVTSGSIDVARIARETNQSLETAARQQRYQFLTQTARTQGCNKIALAHNADDNVETIIHRIIRGTGIRGLAGIPAVRPLTEAEEQTAANDKSDLLLIRPLLTASRCEIEAFVKNHNIAYRQDRSNFSSAYTRNRIRHELLPFLREKYNPEIDTALLQLGEIASDYQEILTLECRAEFENLIRDNTADKVVLDAAALQTKHQILQAQIIHEALLELQVPQQRIGFRQIKSVLDLINRKDCPSKIVQLPLGINVERSETDELIISTSSPAPSSVTIPKPEKVSLKIPSNNNLSQTFVGITPYGPNEAKPFHALRVEIFSGTSEFLESFREQKGPFEEIFDLEKIVEPLHLRTREGQDRFQPLGAGGTKTLGDFFTDIKVPASKRDQTGLVCDGRGIIWVIGLRIADRVKITAKTQHILKLSVFD